MQLAAPIPILRNFDEAKARAFCCEFLGFSEDWAHRFEAGLPLYLQVSRAGACCICPNTTAIAALVRRCV
jgi:hypothetical protein